MTDEINLEINYEPQRKWLEHWSLPISEIPENATIMKGSVIVGVDLGDKPDQSVYGNKLFTRLLHNPRFLTYEEIMNLIREHMYTRRFPRKLKKQMKAAGEWTKKRVLKNYSGVRHRDKPAPLPMRPGT